MKYFVVNKDDEQSINIKNKLKKELIGTISENSPDIVFSIGGDGTVLNAVRKYIDIIDKIKIVAIHTGNLGFYTQFLPSDLEKMLKMIDNPENCVTYPLLEFEIDGYKDYALNEITISSHPKLLKAEIDIDNSPFMDIVANGVCISTPSGSTAYNKSLGGAIMDPNLNAIQLTLIAPFETVGKQMISPFIVSNKHSIVVTPKNDNVELTYDAELKRLTNIKTIKVKISNKKVKFLTIDKQPFINRVREKFITKM